MTLFYTSDLHFSHQNIITYSNRPYGSVDEMNRTLIDNWNKVVDYNDKVMILGDVCMGKRDQSLPLVGLLNGQKTLVCGNHDRCWEGDRQQEKWFPKYKIYFEEILQGPLTISDEYVYRVNHFPSEGDSQDEDRYEEYRPQDNGELLLCGHVHDAWKHKGNNVNVGVDAGWSNGYAPVQAEEIYEYALKQGIKIG